MPKESNYERHELDVSLPVAVGLGLAIAIAIYILLFPFQESFIGTLLYDRGITQYLAVFFAGIVSAIAILKFIKLQVETRALGHVWVPPNVDYNEPTSRQLAKLEYNLASAGYILSTRCSRILRAYIESGSRKTATELAIDDSAFYLSASESSYSVPKILVWAIPLLGFIGTVVGISRAVNGFSGFLEEAAAVEQIKEGIGTVTSGLAVAFDTTLLALLLSVLVMIPLVLVERSESRLLLAVDIYINERLLPKLRDVSEGIDEGALATAVSQAVRESLPEAEDLIAPAREYAQQAATELAKIFVSELSQVREMNEQLVQQMERVNKLIVKDRKEFISYLDKQQTTHRELMGGIQDTLAEINASNAGTAKQLAEQTQQITEQLEQAMAVLSGRLNSLEKCTEQVLEVARLQQNLDRSLRALQETGEFGQVLGGIQEKLGQLQPILLQLGKPRRIMLVERDE
ncbi:MAG: MotA/TolQ/ExbB proton channel family protein [Cyanobacteriota bacterium]|nr:MotA/TolQ/ExbB proton channel family protein [Cyanobacteriota bacterium]